MNHSNKIALVTGANRGLGLEISRQLGLRGITILLGARNATAGEAAAAQLTREGIKAYFVPLEITDADSIKQAVETVKTRFGTLDILVNNAALVPMVRHRPSEVPAQVLQEFMQTNYIAQAMVTQAFLPLLSQSPAGRIVNMSSSVGSNTIMSEPQHKNADREATLAYGPAKAALNMFTVTLAKELRDTPVKVNSADPGWTRTDSGGPNAPFSVGQSARVAVWLACLDEAGPTGCFFTHYHGHVTVNPW